MTKTGPPWLDPAIGEYVDARTTQPDEVLQDLIAETAELTGDRAGMQISPGQGSLLSILTRMVGARRAVEVGTFTGYSSICIARALVRSGRLVCCDVSEEYTAVARRYWARAGVDDRIELRLAPALDTLRAMDTAATLDLAFIDADKSGYGHYWDEIVPRLRPGGVVLVDNTLWSGRVIANDEPDADTVAIRAFNDMVAADDRVLSTVLPVADGLTVAVRG